jgi:hypothetical protein
MRRKSNTGSRDGPHRVGSRGGQVISGLGRMVGMVACTCSVESSTGMCLGLPS